MMARRWKTIIYHYFFVEWKVHAITHATLIIRGIHVFWTWCTYVQKYHVFSIWHTHTNESHSLLYYKETFLHRCERERVRKRWIDDTKKYNEVLRECKNVIVCCDKCFTKCSVAFRSFRSVDGWAGAIFCLTAAAAKRMKNAVHGISWQRSDGNRYVFDVQQAAGTTIHLSRFTFASRILWVSVLSSCLLNDALNRIQVYHY